MSRSDSDAAPAPAAGHREFEHTADVGFEVWAPDLAALFAEATLAVAEICYDRQRVRPRLGRELRVQADGLEPLLVHWLQEVYLLLEGEGWLTATVSRMHVEPAGTEARGTLHGEPIDRERHRLYTEIKAITYHGMELRRDARGLVRTRVVVDV